MKTVVENGNEVELSDSAANRLRKNEQIYYCHSCRQYHVNGDDLFVISGVDNAETCYWSNDNGWTKIDEATIFTEEEKRTLNLPLGGQWVSLFQEK